MKNIIFLFCLITNFLFCQKITKKEFFFITDFYSNSYSPGDLKEGYFYNINGHKKLNIFLSKKDSLVFIFENKNIKYYVCGKPKNLKNTSKLIKLTRKNNLAQFNLNSKSLLNISNKIQSDSLSFNVYLIQKKCKRILVAEDFIIYKSPK